MLTTGVVTLSPCHLVTLSPTSPPDELAELAGGFVHEIKNRLNALSLNLQLLAEDLDPPQTPRERAAAGRVGKLTAECGQLVELANDVLRFARLTDLHLVPTDLGAVVTRVTDFLDPMARLQNVAVHWFPAADLPAVPLDRERFEPVLLNLAINALDAMPAGGTLTVTARPAGGAVELAVIDTGHGMDPALAAKVFRPFVTTKPGGTGLGLATARRLVQAHGGTIGVDSAPGRGTRFTVRLPAEAAGEPVAVPPAAAHAPSPVPAPAPPVPAPRPPVPSPLVGEG
jgi:signal transduction histidine kinase